MFCKIDTGNKYYTVICVNGESDSGVHDTRLCLMRFTPSTLYFNALKYMVYSFLNFIYSLLNVEVSILWFDPRKCTIVLRQNINLH